MQSILEAWASLSFTARYGASVLGGLYVLAGQRGDTSELARIAPRGAGQGLSRDTKAESTPPVTLTRP